MNDWLAMGGYAVYVWSSYLVFVITLMVIAIGPALRKRRVKRGLRDRQRRESRRSPVGGSQ